MVFKIFLILIGMGAYSLGLSFSIYQKRFQKRLLKNVLIGLITGFILTANVIVLILQIFHYDFYLHLPFYFLSLVGAPILEELAKSVTIYYLGFILQGTVNKLETIRLSGGLGLGFGSMETLHYIIRGLGYNETIGRLLITVPFHISTALLIGLGLTKNKLILITIPLAIVLHSLFNHLAITNINLQMISAWIILFTSYFLSEFLGFRSKTTLV